MGSGASSAPKSTSTGTQTSTTTPTLYNWSNILPPWVQSGQQTVLPWLMSRANEGLLPQEQRDLWGQMQSQIGTSGDVASKNLSRQIAGSGMNPSSPMVAGAYSDLASDKMATTSKAALDFAKMKLGAKDTAIGQLLTALYTPSPVAVGSTSQSQGTQVSNSGGGK